MIWTHRCDWRGSRKRMGAWLQRWLRQGWRSTPTELQWHPRESVGGVGEGVCIYVEPWRREQYWEKWECSSSCADKRDKGIGWEKRQKGEGEWLEKESKIGPCRPIPILLAAGGVCVCVENIWFNMQIPMETAQHSYFAKNSSTQNPQFNSVIHYVKGQFSHNSIELIHRLHTDKYHTIIDLNGQWISSVSQ